MKGIFKLTIIAAVLAGILTTFAIAADITPTIKITHSAKWGPGGEGPMDSISGTVNAAPAGAKVVVFAYAGGGYWIQPWGNAYLTDISRSSWVTSTHLGEKYAALLVRPSFRSEGQLGELPAVGGDVLAKDEVPGRN